MKSRCDSRLKSVAIIELCADLHWLLQFLSMIHKELLKDCSIYDKADSKRSFIWMNKDLSDDLWETEATDNDSFCSEAFWFNQRSYSENKLFKLCQQRSIVSIWRWRHSTFNDLYSKNMISAECNYEIYDKELLTIIWCLKHWRFKLKCTDISIKIFINHLNLKYFMIIKKLIRWQTKWVEKLFEYNFKIIYQSEKQNLKADALIRMSDVKSVEANNNWKLYQHQMLLSKDKFKLQSMKADQEDDQKADQDLTQILLKSDSESDSDLKLKSKVNQNSIEEIVSIQNQIIAENRTNQQCINIQTIIEQNRRTCQDMSLDNCRVLNEVLWKNDKLWVSQSMIIQLIRKAHDLSISEHSDMNQTLNLLRRSYCWSKMRTMIKRYIQNCYVCHRSKALRDQINELLKSLLILKQRWQNVSLNFIIDLSESDENNAILTVIDRLSKKRHYISCWSDDEEIFAEWTVKLLLIWVFRTHELSRSIVFDRDSQFISIVWKSLCLRLNIKMKLFINYHSQIDD